MKFARNCALIFAATVASLPALAQNTNVPAQINAAAAAMAPSGSYATLRDSLATQADSLTGDVTVQRAILKKNQQLLKEAQRLDAQNKKLQAEKQRMAQQNAELERQRANLAQAQAQADAQAATQPQAQPQAKPAQSQDVALAAGATTGTN